MVAHTSAMDLSLEERGPLFVPLLARANAMRSLTFVVLFSRTLYSAASTIQQRSLQWGFVLFSRTRRPEGDVPFFRRAFG